MAVSDLSGLIACPVTLRKMRRALFVLAALVLVAATPEDVLTSLRADGFYIEQGSSASDKAVSDAVFTARSDGGRLYVVVLSEEPAGGATTFSDSVLDLLDGEGYVLTIAPETVGYAGDGTFWTRGQMDGAVQASLEGASDDEVVESFIAHLTGESVSDGQTSGSSGSGVPWTMILLLIGGGFLTWWYFSNQRRSANRLAGQLTKTKAVAKEKLDEVANDIIEMEDEVAASDNTEVKQHYQNASAMYSSGMEETERATTVSEMLKVSQKLDLAIWELDCAEALLDGKEKPPKPDPPKIESPTAPAPTPGESTSGQPDGFDRRPQRRSGGSDEMMGMLLTMLAMRGMRGGWGGGFGGGFGGGGFSGGGRRGGGQIRGGGHRR